VPTVATVAIERSTDDVFILVFAAIAVIVVTARALGWAFQRIGLPAVVGEVVGGIVLGPSLLGLLPGGLDELLFPPDIVPYLRIIAQLGLVFYLFIVGLELDVAVLSTDRRTALTISLSSIASAFIGGAAVGLVIHGSHDMATRGIGTAAESVSVDLVPFVLFCGLSICGSAFAILARILDERRLFGTRMGPVLVGCAVVDDIGVWALAAVVLALAAASGLAAVPLTLGGLALFVVFLFVAMRPALAKLIERTRSADGSMTPDLLAALLVGLLASACVTTWLGISPILGAFLFGAAVPRIGTNDIFQQTTERLESVSVLLLLPVFFVVTGLGVDLSGLDRGGLLLLAVFMVVATAGKFVGAALGARASGFRGRRAMAIGCLMNTRGLTELAILSIGRDLGVLDTTMFTVLVTTAVATTIISGPLLSFVYPDDLIAEDLADAERRRLALTDAYRVLVLVEDTDRSHTGAAGPELDLAAAFARSEPDAEVVVSRLGVLRSRGELGTGFIGDLAAMTNAVETVSALAKSIESPLLRVIPLSQFTDDLAGDLLAQVERTRPNLVVLADRGEASHALGEQLRAKGRVDVVMVSPHAHRTPTTVTVQAGTEPDAVGAAEVATRLALGLGATVRLPVGRRAPGHEALLEALGVRIEAPAPDEPPRGFAAPTGEPDVDGAMRTVVTDIEIGCDPHSATDLLVFATSPNDGRRTLDPLRVRLLAHRS
jgi:Kef-type K+ transport system membrane component KefB